MNLEKFLFAESHEWANVMDEGGDKVATIGISAHAVEALTDLVYMDLPDVGDTVTAGESFGEADTAVRTVHSGEMGAGEWRPLFLLLFSLYLIAKIQSLVTGQPPIALEWKNT